MIILHFKYMLRIQEKDWNPEFMTYLKSYNLHGFKENMRIHRKIVPTL